MVGVLVTLSVVLTASVLVPGITARQILHILVGCAAGAASGRLTFRRLQTGGLAAARSTVPARRAGGCRRWPCSATGLPLGRKIGMAVLRSYLALATVLVAVKIVELALAH